MESPLKGRRLMVAAASATGVLAVAGIASASSPSGVSNGKGRQSAKTWSRGGQRTVGPGAS